jgi:lipoprotein-anchoring transpeptidase ErfK/SrfK
VELLPDQRVSAVIAQDARCTGHECDELPSMHKTASLIAIFLLANPVTTKAAELTVEAINSAAFSAPAMAPAEGKPDPFIIRVQVLLDRAHISPGAIDGVPGENMKKAVRSYEERAGLEADGEIDEKFWASLEKDSASVLETYTLLEEDLDDRYVEEIPEDYAEMAKMEWLGYRGPHEMLAERFHMDEDLIQILNGKADFTKAGMRIVVAATGQDADQKVSRIVVDRAGGRLLGYGKADELIVAYPATIGSANNPTPSGTHEVKGIAKEPTYTYNPDLNFQQGKNTERLEIPPGPNGPVGLVWIDLTEPTYGIHGTPDPTLVGKVPSHGCVRLTNWDVQELAGLVKGGVPVEFK